MEQTTLQQRIEERAIRRLLKDLLDACEKEKSISNFINIHRDKDELFPTKLDVQIHYSQYSNPHNQIKIGNEYSQKVFDTLLPKYITLVTDEILQKIDEIDYLLSEKHTEAQDY